MSIIWQDVVAGGIILAALGYVARRAVLRLLRTGTAQCCCNKCPTAGRPLATLDAPQTDSIIDRTPGGQ
jgi:hypothetical protein